MLIIWNFTLFRSKLNPNYATMRIKIYLDVIAQLAIATITLLLYCHC